MLKRLLSLSEVFHNKKGSGRTQTRSRVSGLLVGGWGGLNCGGLEAHTNLQLRMSYVMRAMESPPPKFIGWIGWKKEEGGKLNSKDHGCWLTWYLWTKYKQNVNFTGNRKKFSQSRHDPQNTTWTKNRHNNPFLRREPAEPVKSKDNLLLTSWDAAVARRSKRLRYEAVLQKWCLMLNATL